MRKFLSLLGTLLVIFTAAYGAFVVEAPIAPASATIVKLPTGTTTRSIATTLRQKGIIRSSIAFLILHYLQGGTVKAGVYRFTQPANLPTIYSRLRRGDVYTLSVTIPEGDNMFQIADRLAAAHITSKSAFLQVARHDTALISDLDPRAPSLEGYLFPDTYKFTPGTSAKDIAETMVEQFRVQAARLGIGVPAGVAGQPTNAPQGNAKATEPTASPKLHEIVTLASLIERETPIPSERPLVASVFYNRLKKDMPLATDPSVIYAAILQHKYRGVIYESDLKSSSPYNTYTHLGLPPGPICNPGLGSLQAALHPAKTDYLYFVAATANPSGHSRFSSTLAQHDKDVAAYRKALREAKQH
ncbi:MAG: endolytic transglycosylase MltG [Acidobacteriaceae bacterium]